MNKLKQYWHILVVIGVILVSVYRSSIVYAEINIKEVVSPSGVKAWFIPEPKLPVFSLTFSFKAGSAYEPSHLYGIATLLSQMFLEGTSQLTGEEIKNYLLNNAIEVSFNVTHDRLIVNLRTSKDHIEKTIEFMNQLLTSPRFDKDDFERIKKRHKAYLQNHFSKPETKAVTAHFKTLMGDHPYAHPEIGVIETLPHITLKELEEFFKTSINQDSLIVGACGHVTEKELGQILDRLFAGIPTHKKQPDLPSLHPNFKAQIETIPMHNPQAVVLFSHPSIAHTHPDFMKLNLLHHILGDGSSSRLWNHVREQQGLAYAVSTSLLSLQNFKAIVGSLGCENIKTAEAILTVQKVWQDIKTYGVTQEELDSAKTYLIGIFPLIFSSSQQTAGALHIYQIYGLSPNYFKKRTETINKITLEQINEFAKIFIKPNNLVFTVVGNTVQK